MKSIEPGGSCNPDPGAKRARHRGHVARGGSLEKKKVPKHRVSLNIRARSGPLDRWIQRSMYVAQRANLGRPKQRSNSPEALRTVRGISR